jgi:hypothetical protein
LLLNVVERLVNDGEVVLLADASSWDSYEVGVESNMPFGLHLFMSREGRISVGLENRVTNFSSNLFVSYRADYCGSG